MRLYFAFITVLLPFSVYAKDFGTWGDIYPVKEKSFSALIKERLQGLEESGKLAELQENFKARVIENTLRPRPVDGLLTDDKEHIQWYDPTFIVGADVADHQGKVFAHKGDRINPLDTLNVDQTLYFLDADDKRQIAWMKGQKPATTRYKVILTNGNIKEASEALDTRIYFDQDGALTRQLGITYVPATVVQEGKRLKIVSAAMKESVQ